MNIPQIDESISGCVKLRIVKDYCGGGCQNEFNERFSKYVKLMSEHKIGKIKRLVAKLVP